MSIEVMRHVWYNSKSKGVDRLTLLAIADNANDNGDAFPGMDRLALKTNAGVRTCQDAVKELERLGELQVYLNCGFRTKTGRTNLFRVVLPGVEQGEVLNPDTGMMEQPRPITPKIPKGFPKGVQTSAPLQGDGVQLSAPLQGDGVQTSAPVGVQLAAPDSQVYTSGNTQPSVLKTPPATSAGTVLGKPSNPSDANRDSKNEERRRKAAQRFQRAPQAGAPAPATVVKKKAKASRSDSDFSPEINIEIGEVIKAWLDHSLITPDPDKNYYAIPKMRKEAGALVTKGVTGKLAVEWFKALREDDFWKSKGIAWKTVTKDLFAWCVGNKKLGAAAQASEWAGQDASGDEPVGHDDWKDHVRASQEANAKPVFSLSAESVPEQQANVWRKTYDQLMVQLDASTSRTFLWESVQLTAVEDHVWRFLVKGEYQRQMLQYRLNREFTRVLRDVLGLSKTDPLDVIFTVPEGVSQGPVVPMAVAV